MHRQLPARVLSAASASLPWRPEDFEILRGECASLPTHAPTVERRYHNKSWVVDTTIYFLKTVPAA